MGIKLNLSAQQQAEHHERMRTSLREERRLACELQKLAFLGERAYPDEFDPAPMYLRQARALTSLPYEAVTKLLGDIAVAHRHRHVVGLD